MKQYHQLNNYRCTRLTSRFSHPFFNFILLIFSLFLSASALANAMKENLEWQQYFTDASIKGVFLLCENNSQHCVTNNPQRASTGFIPASTFKIANSLIALETGVVDNERHIFKWDGKPRAMKQWERDLTLRDAIQVSAVPVFQQIARDIGAQHMQRYLRKFSYGNADIGGGIDQFWLTGQLTISAINQITFMESLYLNKLPVSISNQQIVKAALVSEATQDYVVHSKTGFSGVGNSPTAGIAWWVGWIEKGVNVYFFAFNMDTSDEAKLPLRKTIPRKILADENILPVN